MASDAKDSAHYFSHQFFRDLSRDPVDSPIQGQDGMQPQELREPAGIITRPLLSVFKSSWEPGEVLEFCKKANLTLVFKEGNITLIPVKVIVQILLENISNPLKDKKVTGIRQHGVMKEKSRLNNFYVVK